MAEKRTNLASVTVEIDEYLANTLLKLVKKGVITKVDRGLGSLNQIVHVILADKIRRGSLKLKKMELEKAKNESNAAIDKILENIRKKREHKPWD